jgi:hypothetical protein
MAEAMVRRPIDANPVREQGWRSARGLQRTEEKYGAERPELALVVTCAVMYGRAARRVADDNLTTTRRGICGASILAAGVLTLALNVLGM